MKRRCLLFGLLLAVAVAVGRGSSTWGQAQVGSGHSLDANLMVGSGGYNGVGRRAIQGRAAFRRPAYSVGSSLRVRRDGVPLARMRRYNLERTTWYYTQAQRQVASAQAAPRPFHTGAAVPVTADPPPQTPDVTPVARRQMEQISYGVGFFLGQEIQQGLAHDGVDADLDLVVRGFGDGLQQREPLFSTEKLHSILAAVHDQMQSRMVDRLLEDDPEFRQSHDENLDQSRAFLEANKKKPGVQTLPSGVQYEVLQPGTGPSPKPTDTVVVNVRMTLVDGTEVGHWKNSAVRVDKMVSGGAQVLPRMKVGAKWRSVVPHHLAFGKAGRYPHIGPNQAIVAEVELVAIK